MKIICIGWNYHEHIKELNGKTPEKPVFFFKPDTALLRNNNPFFLPGFSNEIHYELEVVLKISKIGKNIQPQFANRYYDDISLGIDFTARDLQRECKLNGAPWEIAKAFDQSAAISNTFISKTTFANVSDLSFHLDLNGKTVQKGNTSDLIFAFDDIVAYVSQFVTLKMGDLIYTGTPVGVGAVNMGDHLQAYLENQMLMDFYIK